MLSYQNLRQLEKKYGSSFYFFSKEKAIDNFNTFLNKFRKKYKNTYIAYSYKTNYLPTLLKKVDNLGGFAEVVSEMEYDLARKIGVLPEKIIVNGPGKGIVFLRKVLLEGGQINIDSINEGYKIIELSKKYPSKKFNVAIRINFKLSDYISRFGIDIYSSEFEKLIKDLQSVNNINLKGFHCHFPNRDLESYIKRAETIIDVSKKYLENIEYIDIGGGFYSNMPEQLAKQFGKIYNYDDYANAIGEIFENEFKNYKNKPKLFIEPGNAIVGDTMYFICKVVDIKHIQGKKIVVVNGSKFNLGLFSSSIQLPLKVIKKSNSSNIETYDIVGYTCIEGDYLFKDYKGNLEVGDYLVFENVGGYSFVFKPPFIETNIPIIEYDDGKYYEIKRKELLDDILITYNI